MSNFVVIYYVLCVLNVLLINGEISDKRLCANKDCTEPISYAKTIMRYGSPDSQILSFTANEDVTIYSVSAGTRENLWGAEIKGKRGYVPKSHIREYKILTKDIKFLVDTEDNRSSKVPSTTENTVKVLPTPASVLQPHEVVDGTTIYFTPEDTIQDTSDNLKLPDKKQSGDSLQQIDPVQPSDTKKELPLVPTITEEIKVEESIVHNKTESLVDNVLSAITNWGNEENSPPTEEEEVVVEEEEGVVLEDEEDDEEYDEEEDEEGYEEEEEETSSTVQAEDKQTPSAVKEEINSNIKVEDEQSIITEKNQNLSELQIENQQVPLPDKQESIAPVEVTQSPSTEKEEYTPILISEVLQTPTKEETDGEEQNILDPLIQNVTEQPTVKEFSNNFEIQDENANPKLQEIPSETIDKDDTPLSTTAKVTLNEVDGIHPQYVTEEPNDPIPPPTTDESTPNPAEMVNSTAVIQEIVHKESLIKNTIDLPSHDETINEIPQQSTENISPSPEEEIAKEETIVHDNNIIEDTLDEPQVIVKTELSTEATIEKLVAEEINNKTNIEETKSTYEEILTVLPDSTQTQIENSSELHEESLVFGTDSTEERPPVSEVKQDNDKVEATPVDFNIVNEVVEDIFGGSKDTFNEKLDYDGDTLLSRQPRDEPSCAADPSLADCLSQQEPITEKSVMSDDINGFTMEFPPIAFEVTILLVITAVTVVIFLWGYMFIDKSRKEAPLIAKINNLEKQFLVMQKENEILSDKLLYFENDAYAQEETLSSEVVSNLKEALVEAETIRGSLEEQVQNLEKELENSTEVGLELNKMLTDLLSSENGSDTLIANIEHLQRQLIEQQGIINGYNENLSVKETENHEIRLELEISTTKVVELQSELNKMVINLLKVEEDKEQSQNIFEQETDALKEQLEKKSVSFKEELKKHVEKLKHVSQRLEDTQRELDLKCNEFALLKENLKDFEKTKNNSEKLESFFDITATKAELLQLRKEKDMLTRLLQEETNIKTSLETQMHIAAQDVNNFKHKYDEADKSKLEAETKLEVLSNYFKDREAHLQKEINKHESMWVVKQGETTSTIERIKFMQEELQNYKAQNESLKQEIVAQEVEMKSQISVLEKRTHENWVTARQAERKLDDAKQEAAQLRNRLTLRERSFNEDKIQNRLQSPLEQNGEMASPMHLSNETAASPPPLLYGTRDHLTTSPALPGLPPFLPPPPGIPFMPPPLGGVHMPLPGFLPPPPSMIPGDHRPPPLGRMSSPPLNSRYSPDTRTYSSYSRNSHSPISDEDYDRHSPPPHYRGYSPYNGRDERRDYNRPPPPIRGITRNINNKGVANHSSGSANSNESIEKINRHNSKV